MLKHTRKGTTIVTQQEKVTNETRQQMNNLFQIKALLCSILLLSRKHLQLFATGSFHFEPANFYSIHFLKVRHFAGKSTTNRFLEFLLKLLSRYNSQTLKKVLRPIFIWRGTCREFFARLATSRPKKLVPLPKKLVKLDFAVVSTGFSEALSSLSHFYLLQLEPLSLSANSKPTLCKTILSSSFVLESRTKTDKLFFLLWRHSLPKSREKQ